MAIAKKYKKYAEDVLSGKIVAGQYIKLACKRYLSFFERDDMYFDTKAVDKVVNFISKLKHFTGSHNNKPFILSDWQYWIICSIFGFKWKDKKTRVTRTAFIQVGRKNGKSSLLAAISLYCLIADNEPNAQVIFAANSAKQAQLCFKMASTFLSGLDPKGKLFKRYRDKIKFDFTKSEIIVTAADATKLDGLNASFFCVDELEEAPNADLWNVLETSQGMRSQPLAIAICTAGFDLSSFCYNMRLSNIEILQGKAVDDSQFSAIYELDEGDDVEDEGVWKKPNPNLDVTIKSDYLRQQLNKAKNNPALQTSVYTKLFNVWVSSSESWIPMDYIFKAQKKWEYKDFEDSYAYVGVDLGATSDLTAISVLINQEDKFYLRNYYFVPEETLKSNPNREKYKLWKKQGFLNVTLGNVTDYDEVSKKIQIINEEIPITQISYDAWNSSAWAIQITNLGYNLVPYSQSIGSMNRPSKELQRLIMSGKIVLYPNPIDVFCFENSKPKYDLNDNLKITKESWNQKIDGVVAMITSLGGFLNVNGFNNTDVFGFNFSEN